MKITNEESTGAGDFRLGTLVGRRQAFGLIAARCSAADVACLREIRDQKSYKSIAKDWAGFCSKQLGLSHSHANRLIRYLEKFGPEYFEMAELAGVSVKDFKAIAPAIQDHALHYDGQAIALLPENAERLAEATARLRNRTAAGPPPASTQERILRIERSTTRLAKEISELSRSEPPGPARTRLGSVLIAAREKLQRLELEFGPLA